MASKPEPRSIWRELIWAKQLPTLAELPCPARLLVPLAGHSGIESKIKSPGTELKAGDPVADLPGSPLAPASSRLGELTSAILTDGRPVSAIELFPASHELTALPPQQEPGPITPEAHHPEALVTWIEHFRASNIRINRRDTPDFISQLEQSVSNPIDTIICTLLDADASLRINALLAAKFSGLIIEALRLLVAITGANRGILAFEALADPLWVMPIKSAARSASIDVVEVNNDYPQADPTLILFTLLKRRLKPSLLPTSQGTIVLDAAGALAISWAARDVAALRMPIGIRNHVNASSYFLNAPVGSTLQDVLQYLKISPELYTIRGGDLLRDIQLTPQTVVGGSELVIHLTPPEIKINPEPCIRSAWCIEACPTLVQPAMILEAAQRHDRAMAINAGIGACIECGLCSHVCPSRLPILASIRYMKAQMQDSKPLEIRRR